VTLCNLVTVFVETKCVTKSRFHCTNSHNKFQKYTAVELLGDDCTNN
jgi:hypothetical protein